MQQNQNPLNQNERPEKNPPELKNPPRKSTEPSFKIKIDWILIFLLLIVLGGVIWSQKQTAILKKELAQGANQVASLKLEWENIKNQIQAADKNIQKIENPASIEYKIVQTQQPQDLVYLIYLAQQYLTLQKNVGLAIQSLRLALTQANAAGDGRTQSLKEQLQKQIHQLETISNPDETELMKQLTHLASRADQLSVNPTFSQKEESQQQLSVPPSTYWERFKYTFVSLLKKAVVVRSESDGSNRLAPSQTYLAGEFQLWLLKAQWAVFQHQGKIYQQSLDQALILLKRYFVQNEKNHAIASKLAQLKTISIEPILPDLSGLIEFVTSTGKPTGISIEKKPEIDPNQNKEMPAVQEQRVLSS